MAHNFVYTKAGNQNLVVQTECRVVRVLFEGTKAVGVEYVDGQSRKQRANDNRDVTSSAKRAYATRLVVLSAGSFGTPAILERSGVGGKEVLGRNGLEQIVDLPGVGENYMDHNLGISQFLASDDTETMDDIFYGETAALAEHEAEWTKSGTGRLVHNALNAGEKLRPTADELGEMGEVFQKRWKEFYENSTDKPVIFGGAFAAFCGNPRPPNLAKSFSMLYATAYPASVGSVHVAHGEDPFVPLDFDCGYLKDEGDLAILRWAYKHNREICRRMSRYRGELVEHQPNFPENSEAACVASGSPVPLGAPKIRYTKEDDAAIDEFHRKTVATAWHALGTCAMKPRESGGVVDSKLNVYGTNNLKLADLSICPDNVGANTANTAIAVGLKAALIIAEELQ